ncbi:hypothetical protein C0993_000018 [Termitomyces sp. T159_Od127]|nr:hypothetical protein C0993_000018 [Termitomyces sp. T159_Od127]
MLTPTMPNTQHIHPQSTIQHLDTDKDINLPSSISRIPRSQAFSPPSSTSSSRPLPLTVSTSAALGQIVNINQRNLVNYLPAPSSAPPISQRYPFHSAHVAENSTSQQFCPAPNSVIPLRKYSLPPSLSHSAEPSSITTPSALLQVSRPDLSVKVPTTVITKDTLSDPSSVEVKRNEEQKPSFGSTNIPRDDMHESASPVALSEAVTPMNSTIDAPSPVTIVSTPPIESLKRPSLSISNVEELPTPKKPRLEEQGDVDGSVELVGDIVETPVSSAEEDPEDSEDDEDEEIRIGPDGLRLVEDCLPALIEDDEENVEMKICKLCIARFRLGYTAEPKPFINATTEELVQHCVSEHQSAWERLRNTV